MANDNTPNNDDDFADDLNDKLIKMARSLRKDIDSGDKDALRILTILQNMPPELDMDNTQANKDRIEKFIQIIEARDVEALEDFVKELKQAAAPKRSVGINRGLRPKPN